jgi:hypothetical protein
VHSLASHHRQGRCNDAAKVDAFILVREWGTFGLPEASQDKSGDYFSENYQGRSAKSAKHAFKRRLGKKIGF